MYDPQRFYGWSINVKINDRAANLTLDTGANGILINRKMAEKAGLKALSRTELHGIGDKGPATGYAAIADSIRIGELEFQNSIVEVSDKKNIVDAAGLIGTDVFSDYLITGFCRLRAEAFAASRATGRTASGTLRSQDQRRRRHRN